MSWMTRKEIDTMEAMRLQRHLRRQKRLAERRAKKAKKKRGK